MTKERLTKHQQRIFNELQAMSTRLTAPEGWVRHTEIGAAGACQHLVDKGWIEVKTALGPRGGKHRWFRPIGA